ncbi:MAG TPA: hypothetical protein VGH38_29650 [Bryobacteraceae bacterium]|jgi:hypothetical protein
MTAIEFYAMAAVLSCLGILSFALFCAAMYRGLNGRRQASDSARRQSEVSECLMAYLSGSNDTIRLLGLARSHPQLVSDAIFGLQGTVGGGALDRLCGLALELGLVNEWIDDTHARDLIRRHRAYERLAFVSQSEPCRRRAGDVFLIALSDANMDIRLTAARGAALSEVPEELAQVFDFAISQGPLVRILLADALRRNSLALSESAIPSVLESSDTDRVLAALEILVAWERAVPLNDIHGLFAQPDKRIRICALKLASLVPLGDESRIAIVEALRDPDAEVSTVAALTAGRLQISEALPSLARLLRTAPADVARSAAAALAEMAPRGWQTLEELGANSSPLTSGLSREALDRTRRMRP